ncbi:MAG: ABC transporter ATP-binding protein [Bernardetiaceae bacterium]|nr:ABC transporter ATP-binding protein [Bernardetiaceae bacterium]
MLELRGIHKNYATEEVSTVALEGVDLKIKKGEFVAITGPSGCGKSTLLNIIGLLDIPTSGELYFRNQAVHNLSTSQRTAIRRDHIGFVFQNFNLIDELTVYENIELPLLYKKIPKAKRKIHINLLMEQMGISHKQNFFPHQLAGGQQQRVAVCRAVISQPTLLLADEPTANLDSVHGQEVMHLLSRLNESGTTIIMVTHSMLNANYSHRVLNLFDGHIVTDTLM